MSFIEKIKAMFGGKCSCSCQAEASAKDGGCGCATGENKESCGCEVKKEEAPQAEVKDAEVEQK